MSVNTIANTSTTEMTQSAASGQPTASNLDKDAFMKLLVAQLQNQDPMAPVDNQQSIAQLAQFSSLEQMEQLNENILGLAVLQQSNALMSQLTSSSALIGQEVKYIDPSTEQELTGTVQEVKLKDGMATLSINGEDIPLGNVTTILGSSTPPTPGDSGTENQETST
jgi:flagellar basal-body rod modification protein FlgD